MRRRSRRAVMPRSVVQSYKKVINLAPTSRVAASNSHNVMSTGVDSVAAGQTSAIDNQVPTGSVIKYFEIQHSFMNLVSIASFMHIAIQLTRSGQTPQVANAIGGNPQRNQVFHQSMMSVGANQNGNRVYRFKVPAKYQRVREGDKWNFSVTCDTIWTDASQIIYKFYR